MTAAKQLRKYIQRIPYGKPFSNAILRQYVSADNAQQILNRMAKNGEITRIARGIFVHLQKIAYLVPERKNGLSSNFPSINDV